MANSRSSTLDGSQRRIKRADPSTIQDKFLVGYQGWFTCQGDGEPVGPGHHGWLHWFTHPIPDGGRPNIDLWPDVSSYSPSELYPAPGLRTKSGEQAFLFSSRNGKTVQRHFRWMAEHGVDGAFLQRFASETDLEAGSEGIRRIRDEVGDRVREAVEKEGRVFAIMYDVSGVPADRIARVLERDWVHLMREKGILDSPNYLKEKGKPVIALWGLGFDGRGHTPALVRSIVSYFRSVTPGGVYIMGGAPTHWRTSEGDADRNPEFVDVWLNEFDAISPWTIGRYSSDLEADNFAETKMKGDSELIKRRIEEGRKKVDYIPVVFPGGSGYNCSEGKWSWNGTKRNGGRFLWKQVYNARKFGVRTMYGAMWDEYDEGTAFMPVASHKRLLPQSDKFTFMALDEDGYDLPPDWYMRICGFAAEVLRSERRIFETFPSKELQDYWASRPKYEEEPVPVSGKGEGFGASSAGGSASGSGAGSDEASKSGGGGGEQAYAEWLATQNDEKEELPPPPYSLEAEEVPAVAPTTTTTAVASVTNPVSVSAVPASPIPIPPPVNQSTYPGQHAPGIGAHDPVTSLASELGRTTISAQPGQLLSSGVNPGAAFATPPLHPAHPSASGSTQAVYGYGQAQVPGQAPNPNPNSKLQTLARPTSAAAVRPQPSLSTQPQTLTRPASVAATRPQPSLSGQLQSLSRPTSAAAVRPQPNLSTHPVVPAHSIYPAVPQQQQQQESATPGPWSQAQWPPMEWGVKNNNTNSAGTPTGTAHQAYSPIGTPGGANLTRPSSFSAGHHSNASTGGTNLRPSATIGGGTGSRPSYGGAPGSPSGTSYFPPHSTLNSGIGPSFPSGMAPSPGSSYPSMMPGYPGQSSPYPPHGGPPATAVPGISTYPGQQDSPSSYPGQQSSLSTYPGQQSSLSAYPGQQSSPSIYPGQQTSSLTYPGQQTPSAGYPGQQASTYPGQQSYPPRPAHHGSPPQTPSGPGGINPAYPPSNTSGMGTTGQPGYQPSYQSPSGHGHGPHGLHNASSPPGVPSAPGTLHFPQGPGEYGLGMQSGYPGGPEHSGYPPQTQHGPIGSSSMHGGLMFPQAPPSSSASGGQGGQWMHGGPPPPPPARPNHNSRPSTSGPSFPMASTAGTQALGFALSAVDKVAGKKTRDQLEAQVGNLAQTGSKLFSKFK